MIEKLVNSGNNLGLKLRSGKIPAYPRAALRHDIQGSVIFKIKIDKNGYVDEFHIISSPHEYLSIGVRNAVKNWFFEPLIVDGKPSEAEVTVQYIFTLTP